MKFVFTTYDGRTIQPPETVSWELTHTGSVPCDSFSACFLYDGGDAAFFSDATRVAAVEGDETVLRGVVDEYVVSKDMRGRLLTVSGRGMAALLLDNHAVPGEYRIASLADILARHVTPYGITVAARDPIPACAAYTVEAGSSEWQALYRFVYSNAGIRPRFDRQGRLILKRETDDGSRIVVDGSVPVTAFRYREKRYGVCSEVWVRDKTRAVTERFVYEAFRARGGRRRKVIATPGRSTYRAMEYSGLCQLRESAEEERLVMLTVPRALFAAPGDILLLNEGARLGITGSFRVREAVSTMDTAGSRTELTAAPVTQSI